MFLDKEYFDGWMQRLSERLERIEKLCAGDVEQPLSILPDGERLLDNYDLCRMLISASAHSSVTAPRESCLTR